MFQKKDIIYNETIGVCQVTEVTKLVDKRPADYVLWT